MITKERLKELIKQGATIYCGSGFSYTYEINFANKTYDDIEIEDIEIIDDLNLLAFYNTRTEDRELFRLESLYEAEKEYEWERKMYTERTERFEPPMWEDIENTYHFMFIVKHGNVQDFYTFDIRKDLKDDWAITIDNGGIIFESEATKENYIKACEMVRDLFKGGNNG